MKSPVEFDYKKATQALNYLAIQEGGQINKMKAIKLIWLAERYHLRKYGRAIVNDQYWAMSFGPVGSSVKDIADGSSFLANEEREYSEAYIANADKYTVVSITNPEIRVFSKTDIEALDAAYKCYGSLDQFALAKLSHDYPEWKKFEDRLEAKISSRELMSYLDFFDAPLTPQCDEFQEDSEQVKLAKELFEEDLGIAGLWT